MRSRKFSTQQIGSLTQRDTNRSLLPYVFTRDSEFAAKHSDEDAHFTATGSFGIEAPYWYIGETARFRMSSTSLILELYDGSSWIQANIWTTGGSAGGKILGETFTIPGNVVSASTTFPALCLTNFAGSTEITAATYPLLAPWYRSQQYKYLEGQGSEVSAFPGTASGSDITLTYTTANNDTLATLAEFVTAFGTYTDCISVDWDGTTYEVTGINTATRVITVDGTPTGGSSNVTIYPHRIAGEATTARVHSLVGKTLRGAGTTELSSMILRRDRVQGHSHGLYGSSTEIMASYSASLSAGSVKVVTPDGRGTAYLIQGGDGSNGTPRAGPDTHGPDVGTHIYQWAGQVNV